VRALVASNAFHYLGVPEWKTRFPNAAVFAPAQAIARVTSKTKLQDFRPLSEAAAIAGSRLELVDMPHYKTGEVLVRMKNDAGLVWYVTDVVMNMQTLPKQFVFNLLFKWSKSGPGLKFNNVASMFMVKDKTSLKRWLAEELEKAPPVSLIPS